MHVFILHRLTSLLKMLSASFLREEITKNGKKKATPKESCGSMYFNTPIVLVCSWTVKLLKGSLSRYIYISIFPHMSLPT